MGTNISRYFKRWNGTSWDTIYFYTSAENVHESTSTNAGSHKFIDYPQKQWLVDRISNATLSLKGNWEEMITDSRTSVLIRKGDVYRDDTIVEGSYFVWNGDDTTLNKSNYDFDNEWVSAKDFGLIPLFVDEDALMDVYNQSMHTATYISNGKIKTQYLPDSITGQLLYGGTLGANAVASLSTDAKTKLGTTSNTITLTNTSGTGTGTFTKNEGIYYIVQTRQTFAGISFEVGDWLISTGEGWQKIDNTDAVTSVNGLIGNVITHLEEISDYNDLINHKGCTFEYDSLIYLIIKNVTFNQLENLVSEDYSGLNDSTLTLDNIISIFIANECAVALNKVETTILYTSTGNNTDGAMTQKAITDALTNLQNKVKIYCTEANASDSAPTPSSNDVGVIFLSVNN